MNVAGQWLNLRGLQTQAPVVGAFPDFDDNLRQAFRRETELFFGSIVHEDRSVLDLLTADYVRQRAAGPSLRDSEYLRHAVPARHARQGARDASWPARSGQPADRVVATRSDLAGAARQVVHADIPRREPAKSAARRRDRIASTEKDAHGGTKQSMRQQMELHRTTEPCKSCHKIMDPIGFTLENFDAIGRGAPRTAACLVDAGGSSTAR